LLPEHEAFIKQQRQVKEQERKIQQQEAIIAQQGKNFEASVMALKKEIANLVAQVKRHDAKIQTVSDRIQLSGGAAKVVANEP
jgi:molecular chaperone GrpE (heat shock protein)